MKIFLTENKNSPEGVEVIGEWYSDIDYNKTKFERICINLKKQ